VPVIVMSTAAAFERAGETLPVAGRLFKPITQKTLAEALQPYR
jgi:hypothetical protein